MIGRRTDFNYNGINSAIKTFELYDAYPFMEFAVNKNEPRFQQRISKQPGKPRYPLRWKSERQRRAFFATNGFGKGIPYRRTGKLARAWVMEATRQQRGAGLLIQNPAKAARFVSGSLARKQTAALRFKQPFHADTGWLNASPIVLDTVDAVQQDFVAESNRFFRSGIEAASTGRAITPRLPRG